METLAAGSRSDLLAKIEDRIGDEGADTEGLAECIYDLLGAVPVGDEYGSYVVKFRDEEWREAVDGAFSTLGLTE